MLMTVEEIAKKLENQRDKVIKNGWKDSDTRGDATYGLNFSKIQEVAKGLENDAVLADELYGTRNHDMKVLATMIDDPKSYTLDELNKRAEQLYPSPFAEKFCKRVLANSEHAVGFINKWLYCEDCDLKAYAYMTLSEVARKQNNLSSDFFAKQLHTIVSTFANEKPEVKEAMQGALTAIASRNEVLKQHAMEVSEQLGLKKSSRAKEITFPNQTTAGATAHHMTL